MYIKYNVSIKTQQFITQNYILERHVSTLPESSSGPLNYRSKVNNVQSAFWDPKRLQ